MNTTIKMILTKYEVYSFDLELDLLRYFEILRNEIIQDIKKAAAPDVEADVEFPHQDCYYNGGCGCNNTRLDVNPRTT